MKSGHFAHILSAIILAGTFSAQNAAAEPAPLPQTDFTAQWDVTGAPDQMKPSRFSYSSSLNKMRIDMNMEGQQMTVIRDMGNGSSLMWSSMMPGMAMRVDTGKDIKLEGEPTGRTDTVSGENCEIWLSHNAEVCITADGIPVRTIGGGVTATMTQIDRSAQDTGQFEAPAGMQVMDMPQGMGGLGGMGAGMPGMRMPF
ncbi:MAG: hypothetical protein KDJ55_04145 [Rhodobiaceae bacterium]|nr:hypothetical protein [Rhodobiaceae bacterium]MCC0060021.1 hypothetical protein [Rhodobiaceae bacterium]